MSSDISPARRAALEVLGRCRRFEAWSSQTLQAVITRSGLDGRDAALCTRLCRLVLQNAALLDYSIGIYCTGNVRRLEPQVLDILRLGACQLLFLDRVPPRAAVNESVGLAREKAPRAAGLVNAVLRRLAENREHLPPVPGEGTAEYLSILYSHPLWLCKRMEERHGYAFAEAWLAANNQEPPLTVTMNPLRGAAGTDSRVLEHDGAVAAREDFQAGRYFVQDAAAAESVRLAAPAPGMRVLDGCAAPGGKSFLAAMLMENRGEILSCDLHEKKLKLIDEGAERLGIRIIRTLPMDAGKPIERLWDAFDLVMADVPCSGLGVIRRKPEIRYKPEEELKKLPEAQLTILNGLARCVRPGGALHYSTCTILPEENEGVVEAFLAGRADFRKVSESTFWPQRDGTDGFYCCHMIRNG